MIKKLLKKGATLFALTLFLGLSSSTYAQYCIPQGTNSGRYIDNFSTTGGTENVSNLNSGFSTGGYGDFHSTQTIARELGESFDFTADIIGGTAGFRVWVDWNQNGVFEASEVAYQSTGYANSQSGTITVPADAEIGETRMRIVSHWLSTSGDVSPCATAFTYGEFEDYKVITGVLDVCTGAVAGTIVGDPTRQVCANAPFSLSVTGNSDPATGLIRTWQSSPAGAGTWTSLNAASATLNVSGITAPTDYRYHVECDNGDSDNSGVIAVALNPNPSECYCTPGSTNASYYIKDFITTGGVQNISNLDSGYSAGGYGDFTAMTVEGNPSDEISFTANMPTGTNTFGFRIWVDWNQDGSFDTTEEVAYASGGYLNIHTGSFTIPTNAVPGNTRMRIVNAYIGSTGDVDPCSTTFTYGEFEDYTFSIIAPDGCTGMPDAGTAMVDPVSGNGGTSYTVSASGTTTATGLSFQWQSNTNGAGWVDEGTPSEYNTTFTATAPPELGDVAQWRLALTCTATTDIAYSDIATFTTTLTYCDATVTYVEAITRVVFSDIDNASSAASTDVYEDFTAIVAHVEVGETYSFTGEGDTSGDYENYFTVWVDWNHNGEFESTEMYEIGSIEDSDGTDGQQAISDIAVPADAVPGDTRMRVIKNFNSSRIDPCGNASFGQVEDYTVNVAGGGGDDGLDCNQGDDSNGFENGLNITGGGIYRNADDFMVSADNTLNIQSIELNIMSMAPINTLDINFYNDNSGAPGATVVESVTGLVPYAQVPVGSAFGYNVYTVMVEVDLSFTGGASGTNYWMEPVVQGGTSYWEVSTVGTLGEPIHSSESGGAWIGDADGNQGVFKLHCDVATAPPTECLFNFTSVEPITRVIMANVDNASSPTSTEALEDFTSVMILAEAGATIDVALEGFTGGPYTNYFTVFINTGGADEWSSYETFEIGSITGSTGTDGQQATSSITLPASLVDGEYLLRIVKNYNASPLNPCAAYGFGQGEDYTLVIGTLGDCSGTPDGGVATVTPATGNPNTSYTVSATGYSFGNGLTYQWQSNTDGAGWVDEGTASDQYASYSATAPATSGIVVEWRLAVTCTLSSETSYSETATFTTTEASVYCTPVLDCEDGDMITNVTFQEIDNTTTCSPDGYGDFTTMVATVQSGGTYPISVSVGDGWVNESVSVWIDFDNSGSFDENEFFYIGTGTDQALTGNIAIPVDAADGNYTMRVRVAAVGATTATWDMSCDEDQGFGETEDYTVVVDGSTGIGDFSNLNFSYHPNPMKEVLYITANQNIESVAAYNVLGQQVLNNNQFADGKVDVSSLPTGTFIFRVTFEGGFVENFKVIKE